MVDAPDSLWVSGIGTVFSFEPDDVGTKEYIRADIYEALTSRVAVLEAALKPFADLPLPEQDGFTLYTRAEILAACAALPPKQPIPATQAKRKCPVCKGTNTDLHQDGGMSCNSCEMYFAADDPATQVEQIADLGDRHD